MAKELWFTEVLNNAVGPAVTSVMGAVGLHPKHAASPINDAVAMEILVVLLLLAFFIAVRATLSVDKPSGFQHIVEMGESFVGEQAKGVIGHHYERYIPYAMAVGFFILLSNLLGLVPGFESPTANPSVPLGCAVLTFFYYHYHGIRHHQAHYYKQFVGPVAALSWLILPIELVSHVARVLSLTVRLFANMFAGDLVTMAFFSLVPVVVPVIFLGLHLGVALVQTFIFVMLTLVYLGLAVSEDH